MQFKQPLKGTVCLCLSWEDGDEVEDVEDLEDQQDKPPKDHEEEPND
jgi:hypothetical protein